MRSILVAPPLLALALSACGDSGSDSGGETMSVEEVRAAAEDAIVPQPGLYRATMELTGVEIGGLPAGEIDMVRTMMGGTQTIEYCLTQQQVDGGFAEMLLQSQGEQCTFERFETQGSGIDAAMTCPGPDGQPLRVTVDGTGTETSSTMNMTMEREVPGVGIANIGMRAEHVRIGDCV